MGNAVEEHGFSLVTSLSLLQSAAQQLLLLLQLLVFLAHDFHIFLANVQQGDQENNAHYDEDNGPHRPRITQNFIH